MIHQRVRGVVRQPDDLSRVLPTLELVELIARVLGRLMELITHPTTLPVFA
jgi:hypothetical protein